MFSHFSALICALTIGACSVASAQETANVPEAPKEAPKKKWDVNNPPGEKATIKLDTPHRHLDECGRQPGR